MKWVSGKVVHGSGRGKQLGFPTANIHLSNASQRPEGGIYACWVKTASLGTRKGALHVGARPTFNEPAETVEIYILDVEDVNLYDQEISFQCVRRLRDVQKFATIRALQEAIAEDCRQADRLLNESTFPPTKS